MVLVLLVGEPRADRRLQAERALWRRVGSAHEAGPLAEDDDALSRTNRMREWRAMPRKVFADELHGPAWDRVRGIRRELFANCGEPLDPEVVPEVFHHLMPYASLLTTGEEATITDFFDALDESTRNVVMLAIEPLLDQLRAYGLGGPKALHEQEQGLPETPERPAISEQQWSNELLIQAIRELPPLKWKGPSPPEEDAMLDLARFYDLNVEEWHAPRSRPGG